jgi:hypothetical protein
MFAGDTGSLEQRVAGWGPFCGQQGTAPAAAAGGAAAAGAEEGPWSTFASAPKA